MIIHLFVCGGGGVQLVESMLLFAGVEQLSTKMYSIIFFYISHGDKTHTTKTRQNEIQNTEINK